ncbi:MAG: hypothetical protein Q8Q14_11105 [Gemmatimonadales bacterium]|nr:hypothetical protein [Gemmatimonadales bacterium]
MIDKIIRAAFWASLRRDEGRVPKISLAYLPPATDNALRFTAFGWSPGAGMVYAYRVEALLL